MPAELWGLRDKEVYKAFLADFRQSVSNYSDIITQLVAGGDMVVYVSTMAGTHTGPMGELPASGKNFELTNLVIHRLEDGKIAENWVSWDNVAMLSQLGFFQPPNSTSKFPAAGRYPEWSSEGIDCLVSHQFTYVTTARGSIRV